MARLWSIKDQHIHKFTKNDNHFGECRGGTRKLALDCHVTISLLSIDNAGIRLFIASPKDDPFMEDLKVLGRHGFIHDAMSILASLVRLPLANQQSSAHLSRLLY